MLWAGALYEQLRVTSFLPADITLRLGYDFTADFADMFEVRGTIRERTGRRRPGMVDTGRVVLTYEGLDEVVRETELAFDPPPASLSEEAARFVLTLRPRVPRLVTMRVACVARPRTPSAEHRGTASPLVETAALSKAYEHAAESAAAVLRRATEGACEMVASNEQFNAWIQRSWADIRMMVTSTDTGPYPYAGVPWFSTAFGRDGIITALEMLVVNPALARGVLAYLAAHQATTIDPEADAEPGKILHEVRACEMAMLGEVPFRRYFGSVDATPLFVLLAGAYYRRTADRAFVESIWPHVERALAWIDDYGDRDGDGFVEYARRSANGLTQQGWKDSGDSVFHADGDLAPAPIALCEVQAYVYAARRAAALLATTLGYVDRARDLHTSATLLRKRFNAAFWREGLGTYALALDGDKRPCDVRTSNAGHCLFGGIADGSRAARVAATLFEDDSFSGWGIRTVAGSERRYNPMAYHNGSVWPHDNAIVAAGLAQYGFSTLATRILAALFDASRQTTLHRLPELFCGFHRRSGEGPTLYPVACAPQSWAAGAVFLIVPSCLGMDIDAVHRRISIRGGRLPDSLQRVRFKNLEVGDARVDLLFEQHLNSVGVRLLDRTGDVEIVIRK
jgi:glycogen debranching enzyme